MAFQTQHASLQSLLTGEVGLGQENFHYRDGALYIFIVKERAGQWFFDCLKVNAEDFTDTALMDAANAQALSVGGSQFPTPFAAWRHGDIVHCALRHHNGTEFRVRYKTFSLVTETWGATEEVGPGYFARLIRIMTKADGTPFIVADGPAPRISGANRERIGSWQRNSNGTWTQVLGPAAANADVHWPKRLIVAPAEESIYVTSNQNNRTWAVFATSQPQWNYYGEVPPQPTPGFGLETWPVYSACSNFMMMAGSTRYFVEPVEPSGAPAQDRAVQFQQPATGVSAIVRRSTGVEFNAANTYRTIAVRPTGEDGEVHVYVAELIGSVGDHTHHNILRYTCHITTGFSSSKEVLASNIPHRYVATSQTSEWMNGSVIVIDDGDGNDVIFIYHQGGTKNLSCIYTPATTDPTVSVAMVSPHSTVAASLSIGVAAPTPPQVIANMVSPASMFSASIIAGAVSSVPFAPPFEVTPADAVVQERFSITCAAGAVIVPAMFASVSRALSVLSMETSERAHVIVPYSKQILDALTGQVGEMLLLTAHHAGGASVLISEAQITSVSRPQGGMIAVRAVSSRPYAAFPAEPLFMTGVQYESARQMRGAPDYRATPGMFVVGRMYAFFAETVTLTFDTTKPLAQLEVTAYGTL